MPNKIINKGFNGEIVEKEPITIEDLLEAIKDCPSVSLRETKLTAEQIKQIIKAGKKICIIIKES